MTIATFPPARTTAMHGSSATRFRLSRAGILNIWQYDDQVFTFADGRLLLRGANGAGKSKTLEMLLPFALDGDKAKMTASAKQHTSLLWLMNDGYDGQVRQGYVWVEFLRAGEDGRQIAFTCGVGIRSNSSGNTVTSWHFATDKRVGVDFSLEDEAGPLSRPGLERILGPEQVFEKAPAYKEYVGRTLFGLDADAYNEVLRLLYWLRQPQIGEDIEPARLAHQLSTGLPEVDEAAVRAAGDAFDELAAFGDQIDRRSAAVEAITALADAYADYAKKTLSTRAHAAVQAFGQERQLRSNLKAATAEVEEVTMGLTDANQKAQVARTARAEESAKLRTYEASPEFRNQTRLAELSKNADAAAARATKAKSAQEKAARKADARAESASQARQKAQTRLDSHVESLHKLDRRLRDTVPDSSLAVPAVLEGLTIGGVDQLGAVSTAIEQADAEAGVAELAVRQRQASLALVREALDAVSSAEAARHRAEQDAEVAEAKWEHARDARIDAEKTAEDEDRELRDKLRAWAADPVAPDGIRVPAEFTVSAVETLPNLAHETAADTLSALYERKATAQATRSAVETEIARLRQERASVAAQRDPAPPAPVLGRTNRPDGAALWQVVDFVESLTAAERAGIEAALQASGILDAWLRPDGKMLGPDDRDLLLHPLALKGGLTAWLVPDLPNDCDLSAEDVNHALASIGTGPSDGDCWASTDGTWQLGPTLGCAAKPSAQHIGATARADERARRLAGLDAALTEQGTILRQAKSAIDAAEEALRALGTWVNAVPSGQKLLQAWRDVEALRSTEADTEQANRRAQEAAETARKDAASARAQLTRIASEQRLPEDVARLAAVEQALLSLADGIRELRRVESLRDVFARWADAAGELAEARGEAHEAA
ncbi:MAG: TIGR02680 family protein, partial [Micrococcales bacterium]|nr:TIGR02680 family protein [Micrococcales bacterium]